MNLYELKEYFEKLPNDEARWEWVIKNPDMYEEVRCDNDATYISFGYVEEDDEYVWGDFDWYIGGSDGVFKLLDVVGIKAESV